jgi:hypothetical protein
MDKIADYSTLIVQLIDVYAQFVPSHGDITPMVSYDRERHRYILLNVGWNGTRRVHSLILHVHISDEKIWIEHDGTPPPGYALALVERGVPKEDIVLAFHHAQKRPFTEFADV